jgi:hypothetical protein
MTINEKIGAVFPKVTGRPAYQFYSTLDETKFSATLQVDLFRIFLDTPYEIHVDVYEGEKLIRNEKLSINIQTIQVNMPELILEGNTIIAANMVAINDVPLSNTAHYQLEFKVSLYRNGILIDGPVNTFIHVDHLDAR